MVESSDRAQPGLLELLARFSPAMPTGAFSYSHGLEWAVEVALVHDAPTLRGYVEAILRQGSGRVDAIFLCAAYGASIAGEFEGRSLDDLGTASPLVDWCSIRHETQYTGLFRS